MLKTKILRRSRIRCQFSSSGHFCRIQSRILGQKTRISKIEFQIKKMPGLQFLYLVFLKALVEANTQERKSARVLPKNPGFPCKRPCTSTEEDWVQVCDFWEFTEMDGHKMLNDEIWCLEFMNKIAWFCQKIRIFVFKKMHE